MNSDCRAIAHALISARQAAVALADYPGVVPASLVEAYAIQDAMIAAVGEPVLGWKVARLPPAMAEQMGASGIVGPVFKLVQNSGPSPVAAEVFAGAYAAGEAEYLLRLAGPFRDPPISIEQADGLVEAVHIGIEVASSPVPGIVGLGAAAVASDFGINNGIIVGPEVIDWRRAGIESWSVTSTLDGVTVGEGSAATFAGGLVRSLQILHDALAVRGQQLRAGQWVASGALTGVHPLQPGQTMAATFDGRQRVSFVASAAAASHDLRSAPAEQGRSA